MRPSIRMTQNRLPSTLLAAATLKPKLLQSCVPLVSRLGMPCKHSPPHRQTHAIYESGLFFNTTEPNCKADTLQNRPGEPRTEQMSRQVVANAA